MRGGLYDFGSWKGPVFLKNCVYDPWRDCVNAAAREKPLAASLETPVGI